MGAEHPRCVLAEVPAGDACRPPEPPTAKRRLKRGIANALVFEPVLRALGYRIVEKYPPSTCMVCRVTTGGGTCFIAKAARRITPGPWRQLEREIELLEALAGHEAVPALRASHRELRAPWGSRLCNLLREGRWERDRVSVLVRDYVQGRERLPDERLSPEQHRVVRDLVERCHRLGYAGIGIDNPRNIILDEGLRPHCIDFGLTSRIGEIPPEAFAALVRRDRDWLGWLSRAPA